MYHVCNMYVYSVIKIIIQNCLLYVYKGDNLSGKVLKDKH